jgi:hypothetical protein
MNRNVICLVLLGGLFSFVTSCVEDKYSWDSINKEGAFSHENGINFLIGSFKRFQFDEFKGYDYLEGLEDYVDFSALDPVALADTLDIENLFSEEMFDYFVYSDGKGGYLPLGDILFQGDVYVNIREPEYFSDIKLSTDILKANGEVVNLSTPIPDQTFRTAEKGIQPFKVQISKDDVVKLKDACNLQLRFSCEAKKANREDYVDIKDISIKLLGGFSFSLE